MNLKNLSKLEHDTDARFTELVQLVSRIKDAKTDDVEDIPVISLAELREDVVRPSLSREDVLANAPDADGVYFIVPKVVE